MKTFNDFVSEKEREFDELLSIFNIQKRTPTTYEVAVASGAKSFLRSALFQAIEEYREAVRLVDKAYHPKWDKCY